MASLGQHYILDMYECQNTNASWDQLKEMFLKGLKAGHFTVLTEHHHQFEPHGVSGVFVLAESHLSFHIWTELKFVSLDVYWCGAKCDSDLLLDGIYDFFSPKFTQDKFFKRGFTELMSESSSCESIIEPE